jgi:hypothetical protein
MGAPSTHFFHFAAIISINSHYSSLDHLNQMGLLPIGRFISDHVEIFKRFKLMYHLIVVRSMAES